MTEREIAFTVDRSDERWTVVRGEVVGSNGRTYTHERTAGRPSLLEQYPAMQERYEAQIRDYLRHRLLEDGAWY